MNTQAPARMFRISWLLSLLAVLAIGALTAHEAEAKPNNGTKKPPSISTRVANATDQCESLGGEIDASYSYEGDTVVGANTSCSGGGAGGTNCTFTPETTDCYQEPQTIVSGSRTVRPGLVVNGNTVVLSSGGGTSTPAAAAPTTDQVHDDDDRD